MTALELRSAGLTKNQVAEKSGLKVFDCALPQPWLNRFVKLSGLDYDLVLQTTVWSYDRLRIGGEPVSICDEVQAAITKYGFR